MTTTGEGRWDVAALRAGGTVALAFAVPLSLAARFLDDGDEGSASGISQLLAFAALLMFVIGAGVAAWHQDRGTPFTHGIVAAGGAFVVGQAVFLIVKLISGDDDVDWLRIAMSLTLTLVAGTLGGFLGSLAQRSGVRPGGRRDHQ